MAKKPPSLSTAPHVKDNQGLTKWLNQVKTILENIDLNAKDIVITDAQIQALIASSTVIQGADGINGVPGAPGAPGAAGQNAYLHLAYSSVADGSVDFSNSVQNKYQGTLTDSIVNPSTNYTDYKWSLWVPSNGIKGDAGADSYTHIKYSNDGLTFTPDTGSGVGEDAGTWTGVYSDSTQADSLVFSNYTWQNLEGQAGITFYPFRAYADDSVGSANFSFTYTSQTYTGSYTSNDPVQSINPSLYTWVLNRGADGAGQPPTSVTPGNIPGLTVLPTRQFNIVSWGTVPLGNDAQYTIIYRNTVDDPLTATIQGTSKTNLFQDYTPADGTYYYWIASQSRGSIATPEGIAGTKNNDIPTISSVVNSLITNANIDQYFTSAAIGTDYLVASSLAALTAILGDVTAGTMANASGTFLIDLVNSFIRIAGPAGYLNDDYILIESGKIVQKIWNGSTHIDAAALTTIETGVATNGATVTLSKYYRTQPEISVFLYDSPVYSAANSGQDQSMQVRAENAIEVPANSGSWQFDAISRLVLSSGSTATPVNDTFNGASQVVVSTPNYVSPASASEVTVSVDLTSIRGTGTSNTYFNRQVVWTIFYRLNNTANSYTQVSGGTTIFGNSNLPITDTQLVTFPSAAEWEFYIEGNYTDDGGTTFSNGSPVLETATDNVSSASDSTYNATFAHSNNITVTGLATANFSYSLPAGWTITSVDYGYDYSYLLRFSRTSFSDGTAGTASVTGPGLNKSHTNISGYYSEGDFNLNALQHAAYSLANYTSSITLTCTADGSPSMPDFYQTRAWGRILNATATVHRQRPQANSTTADNTLKINSFDYALSGFSQLSGGTLRWLAIL